MGYRVHVVKKVEEYASVEGFNYQQSEFESLLNALDCYVHEYEEGNADRFEVSTDEYEKALKTFKAYAKGEEMPEDSYVDPEYVDEAVESLAYEGETHEETVERLLSLMESFYESRDKDFSWMIFVSW